LRRVVVAEGLTAESAAAKLAVGGTAPPLYRHVSVDRGHAARGNASAGVTGSTRRLRAEVEGILSAACADGSFIEQQRYGHDVRGDDPVEGLLELVRREYGLAPDAAFETVTAKATSCARTGKPRPAPLTLATAQQLGVLPTRSVPPLLSHVLPASAGAPAACRAYLQELLLHPPPRDVAAKISTAAAALTSSTIAGGVPRLEVTPPGKVAKLLRTREGSHVFFAEVVAMARAVRKTLTHDVAEIRTAGECLLSPTGLKVGRRVDARALAERCAEAEAIIARVVAAEALEGGGACGGYERERARDDDEEGEHAVVDDDDDAAAFDADAFDDAHDGVNDAPARVPHVPRAFARFNEPWRGRVRRDVVATELAACDDALRALSLAIEEDLAPVIAAAEALAAAKTAKNRRCHLEHDARNNALWLRHVPASVARGEKIDGDDGAISPLIHPRDRYGKEISDRWSTPRVEAALDAYRVSSAACGRAVASRLKALADDLGAHVADLVAAATFSAIAVAVTLHATRATRRGWRPASLPPASDATTPFKTVGLRPFWMDDAGPGSAVENDITLDGVSILTGPNMAGKSTVLRSAAACALLASCGLFVPAREATVPHFDALLVRMSSTDSPAEGLSSYAVEMAEVGSMLDVVTPQTLAFIDELGRGTEATHGTAMAGAVIEAIDRAGARGIFATHLHGVLDLDLELSPYARRVKMETVKDTAAGANGRVRPTWKVVPGECRESLALQTAIDMGVSDVVVSRSKALLTQLIGSEERSSMNTNANNNAVDRVGQADPSPARSRSRRDIAPPLARLRATLAVAAASLPALDGCQDVAVGTVARDEIPPPAAGAWSCVYVVSSSSHWSPYDPVRVVNAVS